MNAIVDDLTNYLGPDPNATGDGGFTKVYQFTAGRRGRSARRLLMDMTFGFSRQKQDVLGPDFNAGNYGLDVLGIPGTNDQGIGDQRYAGYPAVRSPASATSATATAGTRSSATSGRTRSREHDQAEGAARFPRRLFHELHVPRPLAAGNRQPARAIRVHGNTTGAERRRRARTSTTSTRRSCSASSATPTRACRTS